MATTVTVTNPNATNTDVWGRHRVAVFDVEIDDAYPAGGLAFNPKTYSGQGTGAVLFVDVQFVGRSADDGTGAVAQFDYANNKILLKQVGGANDALQEVPTDCAAFSEEHLRVLVVFGA